MPCQEARRKESERESDLNSKVRCGEGAIGSTEKQTSVIFALKGRFPLRFWAPAATQRQNACVLLAELRDSVATLESSPKMQEADGRESSPPEHGLNSAGPQGPPLAMTG